MQLTGLFRGWLTENGYVEKWAGTSQPPQGPGSVWGRKKLPTFWHLLSEFPLPAKDATLTALARIFLILFSNPFISFSALHP